MGTSSLAFVAALAMKQASRQVAGDCSLSMITGGRACGVKSASGAGFILTNASGPTFIRVSLRTFIGCPAVTHTEPLRPRRIVRSTTNAMQGMSHHDPKPTILSRHKLTTSIATGATVIVLATGGYAIANSGSSSSTANATTATSASGNIRATRVRLAGGSNARSGPAAGGASGTVDSVSTSSFTISTPAGQKVTVNKASSTTYQKGTSSISASAITKGESVLVLGTTSGTTITASQVIVQPNGGGSAASAAAGVVPFQRGAPSTSKQVGQIPASYSQGSGTIVSGTAANKATEAALAAYPGGVVDRVVKLSNGEYEVHNIGVNWPHHVFVNQGFKVVGAN